ncbi:hypothetical protein [uncultured Deinococcus sp.]|uniref:hypothetical protein n=1 Tax=uncultured Deinococcus sp. TaxID=158789 RepID=UPI0025FCF51F|nr:hypothetical protein [uncultured Deinococcus sp.]
MTGRVLRVPVGRPASQYAYALILPEPEREPLYLPLTLKPDMVGYKRNVTLDQPPGYESTFVIGDEQRIVEPLVLTGRVEAIHFGARTEDAVRLRLAEFDALTSRAVSIQRGASIQRELWPCGYFTAVPAGITRWDFTFTLFPTGPAWLDNSTDPPLAVPF